MDETTGPVELRSLILEGLVAVLCWAQRVRHLELVAVLVLRGWHCHKARWPLGDRLNNGHLLTTAIVLLVLRSEVLAVGYLTLAGQHHLLSVQICVLVLNGSQLPLKLRNCLIFNGFDFSFQLL